VRIHPTKKGNRELIQGSKFVKESKPSILQTSPHNKENERMEKREDMIKIKSVGVVKKKRMGISLRHTRLSQIGSPSLVAAGFPGRTTRKCLKGLSEKNHARDYLSEETTRKIPRTVICDTETIHKNNLLWINRKRRLL
jgi:hypothetical protein